MVYYIHLDGNTSTNTSKLAKDSSEQPNNSKLDKSEKPSNINLAIKYQVPRKYKDALRLDMENANHKWQDAMDVEMAQIKEYGVSKDYGKATWEGKTVTNTPLDTRRSESILVLQLNTVENLRGDWLLMAISPRNQWNLCIQELYLSEDSD